MLLHTYIYINTIYVYITRPGGSHRLNIWNIKVTPLPSSVTAGCIKTEPSEELPLETSAQTTTIINQLVDKTFKLARIYIQHRTFSRRIVCISCICHCTHHIKSKYIGQPLRLGALPVQPLFRLKRAIAIPAAWCGSATVGIIKNRLSTYSFLSPDNIHRPRRYEMSPSSANRSQAHLDSKLILIYLIPRYDYFIGGAITTANKHQYM